MFLRKEPQSATNKELSELPEAEEKRGINISFTKRVMLVSIAVSLITIISSIVVLYFVCNQHFHSYTSENVQSVED